MIRSLAWGAVFASWFWVDSSFGDPAFAKNLLLPIALSLLLLGASGWPRSRGFLFSLVVLAWGFARMGTIASSEDTLLFLLTGSLGFLAGLAATVPPAWLALTSLLLAVGKGWGDLLLLSNIGDGIPFTATSFFIHKNLFGLLLAPSLLLLLGWVLALPSGNRRRLSCVLFLLSLILLLAGGSNGAVLGFVAGSGAVLLWHIRRRGRVRPALLLGALGFLILLAGTFLAVSGRLHQGMNEIRAVLQAEPIQTDVTNRFRPWVWSGAIRLWEEAPVVGIGVGDFRYSIESRLDPWMDSFRLRARKVGVAHSHWLHTLVERGVVGLVLELSLVGLAVASAFGSGRPFLGGAILCMASHGLVAEGLEYALGSVLWWYLIGTGLARTAVELVPRRLVWGIGVLSLVLATWTSHRSFAVHEAEARLPAAVNSPDPAREILGRLQDAPRSKALLLELARAQVESGDLDGARSTLEHARTLYPRYGAVDLEAPLAGVWRKTGLLDSAQALVDSMLERYPFDPWLLHERLRILESKQGCGAVRFAIARMDAAMAGILHRGAEPTPSKPPRHRLALNATMADSVRSRLDRAVIQELERSREEWGRARAMCAEPE